MADLLQLIAIMANQNPNPAQGNNQQGDNRKAGDVDGNRGAKPKSGSQGVNESAGNQAAGTRTENPEPGNREPENSIPHSEAESLYRDR